MDTEIDLSDDNAKRKELLVEKGRVEFQHVGFSYSQSAEEKVLEDISSYIITGMVVITTFIALKLLSFKSWFMSVNFFFSKQVGDLTAFTTYIVQILMSLMMLSMVLLQSSRAMASIAFYGIIQSGNQLN